MRTFVAAAVFTLSLPALAQDAHPLSPTKIPLRADAPQLFMPSGWKIEKTVRGDLNRDKIADAALVLVQKPARPHPDGPDNPAPRARALVVLLKEGKGWHRVGFNNSLLLGTRDGGAMYGAVETPIRVEIRRGILEIEQDNGSREKTDITYKFRMNKRTGRFYLIGLERSDSDSLIGGGRQESVNYLTGVKKTTLIRGENERETTKTTRVSQKLRSLESVRVEERYSG